MNYSIKLSRRQNALLAGIYIILGLVLCFFSLDILRITIQILGLATIFYGGYELYKYFIKHSRRPRHLFYGLPSLIIGILMVAMPSVLISIFPVIAGMIMLISSISQMQKSFLLKDLQDKNWIFDFLMSIVLMLAGLVLIIRPELVVAYILRISGVFLMAEGAFSLYENYRLYASKASLTA